MTKESLLTIRIDADQKLRITEAARKVGKSISTFVVEATMQSVETAETIQAIPERTAITGGAFPSFFQALCRTAQAGGEAGYASAGYELTRHLPSLMPYELDDEDAWLDRLRALESLLSKRSGSDEPIIEWFATNVPRCHALVPRRRQGKFVEGVRARFENEGLDLP